MNVLFIADDSEDKRNQMAELIRKVRRDLDNDAL